MYFLVDFENVRNEGLRGAQYLLEEDIMIIFFSCACDRIQQGCFCQIMESLCRLDICKLKNSGKNALDFYIAARTGEIFGGGYSGKVSIVSKDQGFRAVRDYWKEKGKNSREVVLGANLEQCILSANENRMRTDRVREQLKSVSLEAEFARYEERRKIRSILKEVFSDTVFEERLDIIQGLFEKQLGKKVLYLDSVKTFGRRDGLEIYRRVKGLAGGGRAS